jgi:hypothetical protein
MVVRDGSTCAAIFRPSNPVIETAPGTIQRSVVAVGDASDHRKLGVSDVQKVGRQLAGRLFVVEAHAGVLALLAVSPGVDVGHPFADQKFVDARVATLLSRGDRGVI